MSNPMVVIVTGARSGARQADVSRALDAWNATRPVGVLIHGDCPDRHRGIGGALVAVVCRLELRGAFSRGLAVDACADRWAAEAPGVVPHRMPASWEVHGKAAGPIRNRRMAKELARYRDAGRNVAVLAFPGGDGTADMVRAAHAERLPVCRWQEGAWCREHPVQTTMEV